MTGTVGILNVGAGDTKLVFDKNNPQDCIRAARIVKDMLRRGYALLIEVERNGKKVFQRATDFNEDTCEYIVADFDPVAAQVADAQEEASHEQAGTTTSETGTAAGDEGASAAPKRGRPKLRHKTVHASSTRAVAVARSAGG